MSNFFNTGLSQQQFLDEYWQKKPLLIRQAWVDFESPISPEDLAGLACEPDIESRLIEQHGQDRPWQVTNGPLSEADFARLPASKWTMLVQDVDKHFPDLHYILAPFSFIPDWRRDDLMISYAPVEGTVGAHTDGYDVFLLQAMGTRRWQISDTPLVDPPIIENLDVQILAEFTADHSWDLAPGDMLYLPPHYAHHGVAINDCMTFSIGFRAPSQIDILDTMVNTMLEQGLAKIRYNDADLVVTDHSAEIDAQAIARLKSMLHQAVDDAEPVLATTLGKFVTETKSSLSPLAEESFSDLMTIEEVTEQFEQGDILQRNQYCRFAWTADEHGGQLFLAGEAYPVTSSSVTHLACLTEQNELTISDWQQLNKDQQMASLLCQLIAEGGWVWLLA
jgi:50S ribosomal protein L16 3-hydroxylase